MPTHQPVGRSKRAKQLRSQRLTTIPFSGFYESWHSGEIDREIEQLVSDDSGCSPISPRLAEEIWDGIQWRVVLATYAKDYAEQFAHKFNSEYGVTLTYESMSSPREYNFTTDRIFCHVSIEDVRKLLAAVKPDVLQKVSEERHTSRSGFISFYSPDVADWGAPDTWDHNQVGTLVEAAIAQLEDENWEMSIIERMSGNGYVSNAVWDGLNEKGKRIADIAYYLRKRQERKYA